MDNINNNIRIAVDYGHTNYDNENEYINQFNENNNNNNNNNSVNNDIYLNNNNYDNVNTSTSSSSSSSSATTTTTTTTTNINNNNNNENNINNIPDDSNNSNSSSNNNNNSTNNNLKTTTSTAESYGNNKRKIEEIEYQDKNNGKANSCSSNQSQQSISKLQKKESSSSSLLQLQQPPLSNGGGKRVHRLIDLCFGELVKNLNTIETLEKLPDELCQSLISIFQRSKLLNPKTMSLFQNCKLTKLDLLGKEVQIQDDWLSITKGAMSKTLVAVNISKNLKITDEGIANLSHLQFLNSLDVSYCDLVRGDGLEKLIENRVPLQKLNLQGCLSIDVGKCIELLAQATQLDSLNISSTKLTNDLCLPLKRLQSLTQLDISNNTGITEVGIQHICGLSTLRDLDISGCRNITQAGFKYIPQLSKLHTLQASDCCIEDEEMADISKLTELKTLTLINNPFTDTGAAHISKLVSLTALDLSMCTALTDEALEHLKNLTQITRLNLNFNSNLTDTGVATLTGGLSDLTSLGIIGCNRLLIKVKHRPLVLLVEDNAMQVTLITKIMERNNFEVEVASNGQMALDMYKANPKYELILMDIIMPIMDGLTATMLIRDYERERGLKRTPVIMQTADTEEGHKKCCLEAGCDDFMLKPLDKKVVDLAHKLFKKDSQQQQQQQQQNTIRTNNKSVNVI